MIFPELWEVMIGWASHSHFLHFHVFCLQFAMSIYWNSPLHWMIVWKLFLPWLSSQLVKMQASSQQLKGDLDFSPIFSTLLITLQRRSSFQAPAPAERLNTATGDPMQISRCLQVFWLSIEYWSVRFYIYPSLILTIVSGALVSIYCVNLRTNVAARRAEVPRLLQP